ncbi:phosphotransferase [soil metagenome]
MTPAIAPMAELVPHSRGMRLVDAIVAWNADSARAVATSHRRADNPLRGAHGLAGVCVIEYAAQTMAAHGTLVGRAGGEAPMPGFIASVREVRIDVPWLDRIEADLVIDAERIASVDRQVMYGFRVSAADRLVAQGRATVVLGATP